MKVRFVPDRPGTLVLKEANIGGVRGLSLWRALQIRLNHDASSLRQTEPKQTLEESCWMKCLIVVLVLAEE